MTVHRTSLALHLRSYGAVEAPHAHAHHQVVLPAEGMLAMRIEGADRADGTVGDGSAAFVVAGRPHAFSAAGAGANRFVVLDLPAAGALPDAVVDAAGRTPFFAVDVPLAGLLAYVAEAAAHRRLDEADARHAAALIGGAIRSRIAPGAGTSRAIAKALAFAEARLDEPVGIAELAAAAGMRRSRFHEVFRRETGRSPAAHLLELRLDRAEALIRHSGLGLAEIALAVGFSEESALSRAFRRCRGTTPARLRPGRR